MGTDKKTVFVRWSDRAFYTTVVIWTGWQLWQLWHMLGTTHDLTEPSVHPAPYLIAVIAWLYAMWTRERKPPRDQEVES